MEMIFLGAGASKELGIKTMQELTNDVMKELEKRGYSEEIQMIRTRLIEFGFTPDFEAIYNVLEGLKDIKKGIQFAGPFAAFISKKMHEMPKIPETDEILRDLRRLIYDECSKINNKEGLRKILEVHDPILNEELLREKWSSGRERVQQWRRVSSRIVTTNYDPAIELYHREKRLGNIFLNDFADVPGEAIKRLDPNYVETKAGSLTSKDIGGYRYFLKLHGSIWYFKDERWGIIETIGPPDAIPTIDVAEEILIYPTKEKPILRNPYYFFYRRFKELKWNTLMVIGYSFRDDPVNTALLEQLDAVSNPHVFVVDPNAAETVKNFPNYRHYSPHFHNVTIEFGKKGYENAFFSAITPYLNENSF